jgi:hypothetical protein
MNQNLLSALAREHTAQLQRLSAGSHRPGRTRTARSSLRVRTGWTLVDLGLRLVAQPGVTRQPRPAGS